MHLSRLYIKDYRSIDTIDLSLTRGTTTIIGRNNAGKSNIIKAIDLVLGESSPTWNKSDNITESDFRVSKDEEGNTTISDEIRIWCELERQPNEDLNWEEIAKCFGFRCYSSPLSRHDMDGIFSGLREYANESEAKPWVWVNQGNTKSPNYRTLLGEVYHFAFAFTAIKSGQHIEKELNFLFRKNSSVGWTVGQKAHVRGEFIQSAIIPSFRDPSSQLRASSWNWYGKLMKHLVGKMDDSRQFIEASEQLRSATAELFSEATKAVKESSLSANFPGAELSFQLSAEKADLYKNSTIYVDDGFKSLLSDKGSGIQSAVIIGLFSYYTQKVNCRGSALLCLEEPELFLHPHARRMVNNRLSNFCGGGKNQVIITTHSPDFIKPSISSPNIILTKKNSAGETTASELNVIDFNSLLLNGNQNEVLFADAAIICEGFDEYILRFAANELRPGALDEKNVSILSVNGKGNIAKAAEALLNLGIPCYILADFDYLLRDKNSRALGHGSTPCSIADLPAAFYTQKHLKPNVVDFKIQSRVQSTRFELCSTNPDAFHSAKHISAFQNSKLDQLANDLMHAGICLLSGEIEDLSLDKELVCSPSKKLNLETVYEIKALLNNGQKMSEIFELSPITRLLDKVLGPNHP